MTETTDKPKVMSERALKNAPKSWTPHARSL